MPSGPPELHEKWCAQDEHGMGDLAAQRYLKTQGFTLTDKWEWEHSTKKDYKADLTDEEYSAISYLVWEWDFGGLAV